MSNKLILEAFKKTLKEDAGTSPDDVHLMSQLVDIISPGFPFITRDIVTFKDVPKGINSIVVPIEGNLSTPGTMTAGAFAEQHFTLTYCTITPDEPLGVNCVWDREYAEDANWGAMEVHLKAAKRAMEQQLFETILAKFDSEVAGNTFAYSGSTLCYADLVNGRELLAANDYTMDYIIVSPVDFASLLIDENIINSLYGVSQGANTGKISGVLGATIIESTLVDAGTVYFIDKRAVTVAIRRDLQLEEYSRPETNKYGFVLSSRYGLGSVLPECIAIAILGD